MVFYIDKFGQDVKEIRVGLCLTQKEASLLSGVNTETIRRIEAGKVIPKFETLDYLSTVYKQDLNRLFLQYRMDDYSYYYEIKNRLENKFDKDESDTLGVELRELNSILNYMKNTFYKELIIQLILFTEAIISYKQTKDNIQALNKFIEAIKITTSEFDLDGYNLSAYSTMEIRILMHIAFLMNKFGNKEKYLEILDFCIEVTDFNDQLYPKLCHNLSGAFIRKNYYEKALEYSNLGIKSSQQNRNINGLNILYYGKGIAEYKLDKPEYKKSLNIAFTLCEAFEQYELKETMINNCRDIFGIEI